MKTNKISPKKTFFTISLITITLIGIVLNSITTKPKPLKIIAPPTPIPSPPSTQAQLNQIAPGYSSLQNVIDKLGKSKSSKQLDKNTVIYSFTTNNPYRDIKVTTKNNQVTLIKKPLTNTPQNNMVQDLTKKNADIPETLYSEESQSGINLYVFKQTGIALIATQKKGLGIEIWYFKPTTNIYSFIENYAPNYSTKPDPFLYHEQKTTSSITPKNN